MTARWVVSVGEWLSLVEHLVRDQGVGGSNPLSPTIYFQRDTRIQNPQSRPSGFAPGDWTARKSTDLVTHINALRTPLRPAASQAQRARR